MTVKPLLIACIGMCIYLPCQSQDSYSTIDKIAAFPVNFVGKVNSRISSLESKLDQQAAKYLARLKKHETRLRRKLNKKDSVAAAAIFADAAQKYNALEQKLKQPQKYKDYIPYLDTLTTSLHFVEQHNLLSGSAGNIPQKLGEAFSSIKGLESQLQKAYMEIGRASCRERV